MQERCSVFLPQVLQDCVVEGWVGDIESISKAGRAVEVNSEQQQSDMYGQSSSRKVRVLRNDSVGSS